MRPSWLCNATCFSMRCKFGCPLHALNTIVREQKVCSTSSYIMSSPTQIESFSCTRCHRSRPITQFVSNRNNNTRTKTCSDCRSGANESYRSSQSHLQVIRDAQYSPTRAPSLVEMPTTRSFLLARTPVPLLLELSLAVYSTPI